MRHRLGVCPGRIALPAGMDRRQLQFIPTSASVCTACNTGYDYQRSHLIRGGSFLHDLILRSLRLGLHLLLLHLRLQLGTRNTTCVSNCLGSGFSSCLICTATACTVCFYNYVLSSGSCAATTGPTAWSLFRTLYAPHAPADTHWQPITQLGMVCIVRGVAPLLFLSAPPAHKMPVAVSYARPATADISSRLGPASVPLHLRNHSLRH